MYSTSPIIFLISGLLLYSTMVFSAHLNNASNPSVESGRWKSYFCKIQYRPAHKKVFLHLLLSYRGGYIQGDEFAEKMERARKRSTFHSSRLVQTVVDDGVSEQ